MFIKPAPLPAVLFTFSCAALLGSLSTLITYQSSTCPLLPTHLLWFCDPLPLLCVCHAVCVYIQMQLCKTGSNQVKWLTRYRRPNRWGSPRYKMQIAIKSMALLLTILNLRGYIKLLKQFSKSLWSCDVTLTSTDTVFHSRSLFLNRDTSTNKRTASKGEAFLIRSTWRELFHHHVKSIVSASHQCDCGADETYFHSLSGGCRSVCAKQGHDSYKRASSDCGPCCSPLQENEEGRCMLYGIWKKG